MAVTGTLNIRLDNDLKEEGLRVLERNGVSVSEAVRKFFAQLAQSQEIPIYLSCENPVAQEENQRQAGFRASVKKFRSLPDNPAVEGLTNDEIWHKHLLDKNGATTVAKW